MTLALAFTTVTLLAACNSSDNYIYVGQAQTTYHDTLISVEVKVTVSNNKLTKIEIVDADNAGSTASFTDTFKAGAQAFADTLVGKTVEEVKALKVSYDENSNTLENVVTGATISSNLMVEAVQNALNGKLPVQEGGSGFTTDQGEDLFLKQCEAAGISVHAYEDPNAPIYEAEGEVAPEDVDVVTGASGPDSDYYPGAGSYQTYEYMAKRFAMKYYYSVTWVEAKQAQEGVTAKTLQEAAALPNAKYIRAEFPNDGKDYSISMNGNSLSSKTLITQDAEGNMTAAIYGMGSITEKDGAYYVSATVTVKDTVHNLLATDKALLVVYEYNPTSSDKMGAGTRNFDCRLVLELDRQQSMMSNNSPVGDNKTLPEGVTYVRFVLKVTQMWTIG